MAKQTINVGVTANDRKGDPLRIAFQKTNSNFTETYDRIGELETAIQNIEIEIPDIPSDISDLTDSESLLVVKDHVILTSRLESDPSTIVNFVKEPNTSSNTVFDAIDEGLSLTRDATGISGQGGGLYNRELEPAWNQIESPLGTEWNLDGWENLDDVRVRFYEPLREVFRNRIGENIVGAKLVMHDIANDRYYKFEFSQWQQGADHNGSFAYTRELIDTSKQVGITYPDGSIQVTRPKDFTAYKEIFVGDTSNYDVQPKDAGKYINAFNNTIYVPDEDDYDFPKGSFIVFVASFGPITIEPRNTAIVFDPNGSQTSSWIIPQGTTATLIKTNSNRWFISAGVASTSLPYLELTNKAIVVQPIELDEEVVFEKEDYDTSNTAIDFIDDGLALTRGNQNYLYNPLEEEQVDRDVSPIGTLWNKDGWDDLSDFRERDYGTFDDIFGGNLTEITDYEIVMHDTINGLR